MNTRVVRAFLGTACGLFCIGLAQASPILWISDERNNIGQVDIATQSVVAGSVHNTGQQLTDIAFNSAGTLYGTSFTSLYTVNPSTGAAALVGAYSPGQSGMNALEGNGGNLLGASSTSNLVYSINATTAATSTFATNTVASSGDLAFLGNNLFETTVTGITNSLLNVTSGITIGVFHVGNPAGATVNNVFGLASDGSTLYAVSGTEVYSVNTTNAVLTPLFDYSLNENGQSLVNVLGAAIAPTPEPGSILLLGSALGALCWLRKRG